MTFRVKSGSHFLLLRAGTKAQVVFAGATVQQQQIDAAVSQGWLVDPAMVKVGESNQLPAGLTHRYIVCEVGAAAAVEGCRPLYVQQALQRDTCG